MAKVTNNVVKMEWETSGWYEVKVTGRSTKIFVYSSVVYPSTTKNRLTVFFRPAAAFLWISDAGQPGEDFWSAAELKTFLKSGQLDDMFPECYDEYVPITYVDDSGEIQCMDSLLDTYGLAEYRDDIIARVKDVEPYGYVKEVKIGEA